MAYSVEKTARTVQEAVMMALDELKADENSVDVEVIDEGNKGIFGLIGNKQAKVRVTLKESRGEKAKKFLFDVFGKMKIDADIDMVEDDSSISLNIKGNDMGVLIGRRGETLDSLQYLSSLVANKESEDYKRVVVDIENYRMKREETLVNLANRLAEKVVKYKKNVTLEPMNPYERRVIHSTLQNNKYVETYSIGDEPNRKVVITLK
jgi:spoIIIJ-associated protein